MEMSEMSVHQHGGPVLIKGYGEEVAVGPLLLHLKRGQLYLDWA